MTSRYSTRIKLKVQNENNEDCVTAHDTIMNYTSAVTLSSLKIKHFLHPLGSTLSWIAITHLSFIFSVNLALWMSAAGRKMLENFTIYICYLNVE